MEVLKQEISSKSKRRLVPKLKYLFTTKVRSSISILIAFVRNSPKNNQIHTKTKNEQNMINGIKLIVGLNKFPDNAMATPTVDAIPKKLRR
jgi:hypothetical protein